MTWKNWVDTLLLETVSERSKILILKEKYYKPDGIALKMGHEIVHLLLYDCQ